MRIPWVFSLCLLKFFRRLFCRTSLWFLLFIREHREYECKSTVIRENRISQNSYPLVGWRKELSISSYIINCYVSSVLGALKVFHNVILICKWKMRKQKTLVFDKATDFEEPTAYLLESTEIFFWSQHWKGSSFIKLQPRWLRWNLFYRTLQWIMLLLKQRINCHTLPIWSRECHTFQPFIKKSWSLISQLWHHIFYAALSFPLWCVGHVSVATDWAVFAPLLSLPPALTTKLGDNSLCFWTHMEGLCLSRSGRQMTKITMYFHVISNRLGISLLLHLTWVSTFDKLRLL